MEYTTFHLETTPRLASPAVIIGFRGWGNALDVSAAMATYIVDRLNGRAIGRIDSDACYRYDDNRPVVNIQAGELKSIDPPGGRFFALHPDAGEKDLLVLVADEPHLNWQRFSNEVVELAVHVGAPVVLTLGSMFDHVLHTDRIISAASTGGDFEAVFRRFAVAPIDYQGPSAIHSLILDACRKRGIAGASLWSHCPAYLQGITHHGLMMALGRLLADLVGFSLPTDRLESRWEALEIQIGQLISENPKLEGIIDQIRKKKRAGTWKAARQGEDAKGNVINLEDFRDP
jgi:predicted ATP-grasp superfamily ATP-dependent carboligase